MQTRDQIIRIGRESAVPHPGVAGFVGICAWDGEGVSQIELRSPPHFDRAIS